VGRGKSGTGPNFASAAKFSRSPVLRGGRYCGIFRVWVAEVKFAGRRPTPPRAGDKIASGTSEGGEIQ